MTVDRGLRARAQALMKEAGIDLLLVSPSADLRYLTGYARGTSERPTLLALQPAREALMLVPQLEAAGAAEIAGVRLLTYSDTDNPFAVLSSALGIGNRGPSYTTEGRATGGVQPSRIAISDQTWARVLLQLQATFHAAFVSAAPLLGRLRVVKGPDELELLERAGRVVDATVGELVRMQFAGRTERQIADEVNRLLREQDVEVAEWGPIVASGPNAASPHHMTGNREIREGDTVILDFGCSLEGYQADITRTVHVGEPSDEFRRVYTVVQEAQQAGVEAAGPGKTAQTVDRAARRVIDESGYGEFFVHRTGHGIGLEVHEEPYIVEGNELPLQPGMVFSVEPGIYLPGRFGVRIEDIVALTEQGLPSGHPSGSPRQPVSGSRIGVVTLGSCDLAVREALDLLADCGVDADYMRVRGFPFDASVEAFLDEHDRCFVVEQNRDAQLRSLLILETRVAQEKLQSVLVYGGFPLSAQQVIEGIMSQRKEP